MQNVRRVSVRRVSVSGAAAVRRAVEDFRSPVVFELLEPRLMRSITPLDESNAALEAAAPAALAANAALEVATAPSAEHFAPLDLGDVESAVGVAVQPDGKVIIFGFVGYVRPQEVSQVADRMIVARYNADGTLDGSYGTQSGYSIIAIPATPATLGCDVLVAADGSTWIGAGEGVGLLKVSADGRTHQMFPNIGASQIALQADGKVVYAGIGQTLGRLNADGSVDTTFGVDGFRQMVPGEWFSESDLTLDAHGRILVSGTVHLPYVGDDLAAVSTGVVARFTSDGTLDASFADGGVFRLAASDRRHEEFAALAVRSDGKIVIGGHLSRPVPHPNAGKVGFPDHYHAGGSLLVRLNTDGTLDAAFGEGGLAWRPNDRAQLFNDLRIAADGRIVGAIYTSNTPGIAVYEADGRGDVTLLGGGAPATHWPIYTTNLALAPDGSFFAVGHLSIQDRGGEIPAATAAAHVFLSRFTLGPAASPSDLGPDDTAEPPGGDGGGGGTVGPAPGPDEPAPQSQAPGIIAGAANDALFDLRDDNLFRDFQRERSDEGLLDAIADEDEDALPQIL